MYKKTYYYPKQEFKKNDAYNDSAVRAHEVVQTCREDVFICSTTDGRRLSVIQAQFKVADLFGWRKKRRINVLIFGALFFMKYLGHSICQRFVSTARAHACH
jgi:hypothetical protein